MLSFWLPVKAAGCTPLFPKVLHELAGEPLLGHVMSVAKSLVQKRGGRIRVVTGHGSDQVDPFVLAQGLTLFINTTNSAPVMRFKSRWMAWLLMVKRLCCTAMSL